jgi:hypothetical protein
MFYPLNYGNATTSKPGPGRAGKPASAGWA